MKILVIGSGGREHALVWKLAQSVQAKQIFAAPGSDAMRSLATPLPISTQDIPAMLAAVREQKIDLVVVGPELPLTLGLGDRLRQEGIPVVGPNQDGARLEGSKKFTKQLLREEGIPTASFESFSDYEAAVDFLMTQAYPLVIKADGLAAGKGVVICRDRSEAVKTLDLILKQKVFGDAGREVVIEEFLQGEEASFHLLVDGHSALPLASAQDHKRVFDRDAGPNTGGMGAYSPTRLVTEAIQEQVMQKIILPTLAGLKKRGIAFQGVLYAGLMLTREGPKLLEYNVRFGDPETQAMLVRLEGDLLDLFGAMVSGKLAGKKAQWKAEASVCVVMAAQGYPGEVHAGDEITGLEAAAKIPETVLFHSGTRKTDRWVTAGGRVLGVTSLGKNLRGARERAYDACDKIYWRGVHYRKDIGLKGLGGS